MVLNNFFTKLETIEPRSTEVIVLYFDSDCSLDELENIGKTIQKEFPNNKIICISDKVDLKLWDRDTLENYVNTLNEILEEL